MLLRADITKTQEILVKLILVKACINDTKQ